MRNRFTCRLAIGLVLALAILGPMTLVSHANASGPPPGATGAPGEADCTFCHLPYPVNSGTATFSIGAPAIVHPATSYPVTVSFGNTTGTTHGFQITARDGAGQPSGSWSVSSPGMTQNTASSSSTYHEHTAAGTALTSWTMFWNAPGTLPSGPVTFYAAGNEANGDGSDNFDHIYTTHVKSSRLYVIVGPWTGQRLLFALNGASYAGHLYFIIPSDDPTPFSLGVIGSPLQLEVTPNFAWLDLVTQYPQIFQNFSGLLDAAGQATASLAVPPGLSGFQFHVAALTLSPADLSVTEVSNRQTVVIP